MTSSHVPANRKPGTALPVPTADLEATTRSAEQDLSPHVAHWLERATFHAAEFDTAQLIAAKADRTVSVVLPAKNEQDTVGGIVTTIRRDLMDRQQLVDEVVVIDSHSTDHTAVTARAAGAKVHHQTDIAPEEGDRPGKAEAMWKSLFVTGGDILVFVDADLTTFTSDYVVGLLGPLLTSPNLDLAKAFYNRPLGPGAGANDYGRERQVSTTSSAIFARGGRVTELTARPLISLYWPDLSGFVQPLSGEYAVTRRLLTTLPFAGGYGVEIGMLIDTLRARGLNAMAQVDLGERGHSHSDLLALGRMALEVQVAAAARLGHASQPPMARRPSITQFDEHHRPITTTVQSQARPPVDSVSRYHFSHRLARVGLGGGHVMGGRT